VPQPLHSRPIDGRSPLHGTLNFGSTERAPCDLGIALRKLGERRHLAFCEAGRLKVTRGHSARRYAVGGAC